MRATKNGAPIDKCKRMRSGQITKHLFFKGQLTAGGLTTVIETQYRMESLYQLVSVLGREYSQPWSESIELITLGTNCHHQQIAHNTQITSPFPQKCHIRVFWQQIIYLHYLGEKFEKYH